MNGDDEEPYSYYLDALSDYDPNQYQPRASPSMGVGGVLNTPPGPSPSPSILGALGPTIGVGTNMNPSPPSNTTVGVGGLRSTVGYKTPLARPGVGGKEARRVPRQNTPSSPSDHGSLERSSASGSSSNGGSRRSGGS